MARPLPRRPLPQQPPPSAQGQRGRQPPPPFLFLRPPFPSSAPGRRRVPHRLYEHGLLGTDPARVNLTGPSPSFPSRAGIAALDPRGRQRASCVRRGRQPGAGGRARRSAKGRGRVGKPSFSGEGTKRGRGKRAMGKEEGREGDRGCCRAGTPRRQPAWQMGLSAGGCAGSAGREGEGKEARRQLPRTMAARPPSPPSSLFPPSPSSGCRISPPGTRAQGPATPPASSVPAASPPRVSSGAAGGAGAAGRPGGSRAPPAR